MPCCIFKKQFSTVINDKEAVNTPAESWTADEKHELLREQNQAVINEAIGAGLLNPEYGDAIIDGELLRSIERDSMV